METNTVVVLLVVVGLGGLAFWLLTRDTAATVPLNTSKPDLCATGANVAIQAGAVSQGVKTGDQQAAGAAACDLIKGAEQVLNTVVTKGGLSVSNMIGRPGESTDKNITISRTDCEGWNCAVSTASGNNTDTKVIAPPVTPQIVAARRTFLTGALASSGGRKFIG